MTGIELAVGGLDDEGATVGHRVPGIYYQVHHDLLELAAVYQRPPE